MKLFPRKKRPPAATRHWNGQALLAAPPGAASGGAVALSVPARLVSFHTLRLPDAPERDLKAAAALAAEEAFSALGPVAVDAVLHPAKDGARTVLLAALPRAVLVAACNAALAEGAEAACVGVAELGVAPDAGGLVRRQGEAAWVAFEGGLPSHIEPLGKVEAPGFDLRAKAARLRMPSAGAPTAKVAPVTLDFLEPGLLEEPAFLATRAGRTTALAVAAALALALLAGGVAAWEVVGNDRLAAQAQRLHADTAGLSAHEAELRQTDKWFEGRATVFPVMAALTSALGEGGDKSGDKGGEKGARIRLTRFRYEMKEAKTPSLPPTFVVQADAVAQGNAQATAFLGRLRANPRVADAAIGDLRAKSAQGGEVAFSLSFAFVENGAPAKAKKRPIKAAGQKGVAQVKPGQDKGKEVEDADPPPEPSSQPSVAPDAAPADAPGPEMPDLSGEEPVLEAQP